MEVLLIVCTLIGGFVGILYLIERARGIEWRKVRLSSTNLPPRVKPWPDKAGISFPEEIQTTVDLFYPHFRLPQQKDIQGDWALYGDSETLFPFLSTGNYLCNADQDYALFILGKDKQSWKVIVLNRSDSGRLTPLELKEGIGSPNNMFVQTVKPGRYRTAYGKGYDMGEREKGPRLVELNCDGINLGTFESADALYYWDQRKEGFVEVWMSD